MFNENEDVLPDGEVENKPEEAEVTPAESEEVDYKAELERERKLREKAESSAQYHREQAQRLREESRQEPAEPDEDEKPLTKRDLQNIEASLMKRTFRNSVESEVRKIARNQDEAALILHHYDYSIVPSGDISTDVSRARLLANEKRIAKEREEMIAAVNSASNKITPVSSGTRVETQKIEPKVDAETRKYLGLAKMEWDPSIGKWKNKRGVTMDTNGNVVDPNR